MSHSFPEFDRPPVAETDAPLAAWEQCLQSLLALHGLEDDWDGEGSRRPNEANVKTAIAWVNGMGPRGSLPFAPQVMPGTNGEVSLIWRRRGEYLEAEINEPGRFEWMRMREGLPAEFCANFGELPTADDWRVDGEAEPRTPSA